MMLDFFTEDKVKPEILLHSDYINWLKKKNIQFKAWGSAGPDLLFPSFNVIGEIKKENSKHQLKLAIKELYERTKPEFKISNFNCFFVICDTIIRVYTQTSKQSYDEVDLNDCIVFTSKEKDLFLKYICNNTHKLLIENHLEYAIDFILDESFGMCISDGLKLIFNLADSSMTFTNNAIYLYPNTDNETIIKFKCTKEDKLRLINFTNMFTVKDVGIVKKYIKHNYSSHLPDSKKANLGKYYTPAEIVEAVKKEIEPQISDNTIVLDLACGCGAFLELFDDCHIVGRDIDEQAIEILDLFNFSNIEVDNSLLNINREKYNIQRHDKLIIIGNPPYNDTSSINKRYSTKAKNKNCPVDKEVKRRDIGRSFLETYAKLKPEYICVLHPLSFLIKKSNFNELKILKKNYRLVHATIFCSKMFKDLEKKTPFPIIIATYKKNSLGMDYKFIMDFQFEIYNTNKVFSLTNVELAGHDYIHQTVTKVDTEKSSDIGLYHYNFRDINSLNKANFQSEEYRQDKKSSMLVVNYNDLWKYCYINCIKKFLLPQLTQGDNYILGNLNPVIRKRDFEQDSPYWRDLFVIGSILKNSHRLNCFSIENRKNNLLSKKFMINDYKKRSKTTPSTQYNFYKDFLDYIETNNDEKKDAIYDFITGYFSDLINDCLLTNL